MVMAYLIKKMLGGEIGFTTFRAAKDYANRIYRDTSGAFRPYIYKVK